MDIKNKKLRKMMDEAGYQDFTLVRGEGYFYVAGETQEAHDLLDNLYSNDIMVCYFNQMTVEDWFEAIDTMIKDAKKTATEGYWNGDRSY